MGIPGLINAIGSGERISLSKLAITHLERTRRPIRIAVDISIWLFQVQASRGGRNPELRTLFYRLLKFLALPIHPLFVYDGREKPPFKRGKATSGSYGSAPIVRLSKILVDLFKFPRHDAPGEAEAECARLQRSGVVDCVMSNDVDALMFGSTLTIMNFSKESGSGPATHVTCYNMGESDIPSTASVDRAGMILFAMLSGGDYLPSGVPKCGSKLAAEIARAGFGADLMEIISYDGVELDERLAEWRERLQYELEENESGYFQTKHKAVRIPDTFPDKQILSYYAKPIVSTDTDIRLLQRRLVNAWDQDIDVMELRQFTADAFEWNYRSGARKVIRLLAEPLVSHRLRLQKQASAFRNGPTLSNNPTPMLQKVYKSRTIYSTDGMSELQLDYIPIDVVGLDLLAEEPNPPVPSQETTGSGDEEEVEPVEELAPPTPSRKDPILKYGTLMKESAHASQFKNAQLFEAAVSATPTKQGSSQSSTYSPQYMASLESPVINDLTAGLTSACNLLSPTDIKRHPMLSQSRRSNRRRAVISDEVEVEPDAMEIPSPAEETPSPSVSRKIRMSYSNTGYAPDYMELGTPSPTPKRSSRRNLSSDVETSSEISPPRIQDLLEKAALDMRSIQKRQNTEAPALACKDPSGVAPNEGKAVKQEPKMPAKEPASCRPGRQDSQAHMKSVVVKEGYWTTESTPEPAHESGAIDRTVDGRSERRAGRKKIPRVSIVDLTDSS
ncbi:hypothetical protein BDV59DRAFT_191034 [Aspergillus ambiguus]|uniref:crossover junction endodeoxyribonuclease n=1 Tax=Aspergillus ambiguus TaxID=176160 RepID=UPI003CCDCBF9